MLDEDTVRSYIDSARSCANAYCAPNYNNASAVKSSPRCRFRALCVRSCELGVPSAVHDRRYFGGAYPRGVGRATLRRMPQALPSLPATRSWCGNCFAVFSRAAYNLVSAGNGRRRRVRFGSAWGVDTGVGSARPDVQRTRCPIELERLGVRVSSARRGVQPAAKRHRHRAGAPRRAKGAGSARCWRPGDQKARARSSPERWTPAQNAHPKETRQPGARRLYLLDRPLSSHATLPQRPAARVVPLRFARVGALW